jgi:hypothetical protein
MCAAMLAEVKREEMREAHFWANTQRQQATQLMLRACTLTLTMHGITNLQETLHRLAAENNDTLALLPSLHRSLSCCSPPHACNYVFKSTYVIMFVLLLDFGALTLSPAGQDAILWALPPYYNDFARLFHTRAY